MQTCGGSSYVKRLSLGAARNSNRFADHDEEAYLDCPVLAWFDDWLACCVRSHEGAGAAFWADDPVAAGVTVQGGD
jgi:hypothetical protein